MDLPPKPSDSDCCNSGCNPCILDVYEDQLKKYQSRSSKSSQSNTKKNCICETTYTVFKLIKIVQHTSDTRLLTFQYAKPYSDLALAYKPGQHFLLKGKLWSDKDSQFTRAYTPILLSSADDDLLSFTIVVRLYKKGVMSHFLEKLQINANTLWRGPYGAYEINYGFRHMFMIAQGTGIAPLYAVIVDILSNNDCESFLKLFYCCRNEQDILLRSNLYELSSFWNFSYEVFLTQADDVCCKYNEIVHVKRLDKDVIKAYVQDKVNIQVLICGSEAFHDDMLEKVVRSGVDAQKTFLF